MLQKLTAFVQFAGPLKHNTPVPAGSAPGRKSSVQTHELAACVPACPVEQKLESWTH
jgi:hypothetical protein